MLRNQGVLINQLQQSMDKLHSECQRFKLQRTLEKADAIPDMNRPTTSNNTRGALSPSRTERRGDLRPATPLVSTPASPPSLIRSGRSLTRGRDSSYDTSTDSDDSPPPLEPAPKVAKRSTPIRDIVPYVMPRNVPAPVVPLEVVIATASSSSETSESEDPSEDPSDNEEHDNKAQGYNPPNARAFNLLTEARRYGFYTREDDLHFLEYVQDPNEMSREERTANSYQADRVHNTMTNADTHAEHRYDLLENVMVTYNG